MFMMMMMMKIRSNKTKLPISLSELQFVFPAVSAAIYLSGALKECEGAVKGVHHEV